MRQMPPAPERAVAAGYGGDFAHAHRQGNSDFARLAAPTVLANLRAAGIRDGLVVELGCGTGILAAELLAAGYRVVGVDLSADMVSLARQTAPEASFVVASFLDVDLPDCAAVVSVGQSLGYAIDPRNSRDELTRLFGRARDAVRPGGLLLFDLNAPPPCSADDGPHEYVEHRETPDWTMLVTSCVDGPVLTRKLTLFRRIGGWHRRSDEQHVVLLHEPATVLAGLAAAGFTATTYHDYDGSPFPPDLVGYRAFRP